MMARVDCRRLGSDLAGPDWVDPGLVGCLAGRFAVRVAAHLAADLVGSGPAVGFDLEPAGLVDSGSAVGCSQLGFDRSVTAVAAAPGWMASRIAVCPADAGFRSGV